MVYFFTKLTFKLWPNNSCMLSPNNYIIMFKLSWWWSMIKMVGGGCGVVLLWQSIPGGRECILPPLLPYHPPLSPTLLPREPDADRSYTLICRPTLPPAHWLTQSWGEVFFLIVVVVWDTQYVNVSCEWWRRWTDNNSLIWLCVCVFVWPATVVGPSFLCLQCSYTHRSVQLRAHKSVLFVRLSVCVLLC